MPFKSEAQRKWMYANHPSMAKRWEKHTSKNKKLPKKLKKSALLNAFNNLGQQDVAVPPAQPQPPAQAQSPASALPSMTGKGMQKLDRMGIGPEALQAIMNKDYRTVFDKAPLLQKYKFEKQDRIRRIKEELQNPGLHLKPEIAMRIQRAEQGLPLDSPSGTFTPVASGLPAPPSNLLGMFADQGMTQEAGFKQHVMKKLAEEEHEEGEIESPEEEAQESLPPDILNQLVGYIKQKGPGIDDAGFHQQAESLGVDAHEAEEEMYRLLSQLIGGENDLVSGGRAAGMPSKMFPPKQLEQGVKVELEHTPNRAVAEEIAKDHLAEGDDYYLPRLEDLEQDMDKDVEAGKTKPVGEGTPRAEKNKKVVKQDVKKLEKEKKAAFKYGFYTQFAEQGVAPNEVADLVKQAEPRGLLAELLRTGVSGAKGLALLAILTPTLGVPLLGAGGALSAYQLSKEKELDPEELKHVEQVALYNRLARQAKARTKRKMPDQKEDEGTTSPDDAHKKILPMPSMGVEI